MLKSLIFSILAGVLIIGCSNNSRRKNELNICEPKWSPVSIDNPDAKEKVDTSDQNKALSMNLGDYTTPSLRLIYFDKTEDIKIDMTISLDSVSKDGSVAHSINCIGGKGLKPDMQPLTVQLPYVSKMKVEANDKMTLSTDEVTLEIASKKHGAFYFVSKLNLSSDKSESLKNKYPKDDGTQHMIYKIDESSYESRVQLQTASRKDTSGKNLDLRAIIGYKRTEQKPTDQ